MISGIMKEEVMLGDACQLIKNIPDESINLILTDPPYSVDMNNKHKELEKIGKPREKQVKRDESFKDELTNEQIKSIAQDFYRVLKNNSHIYVFSGDKQLHLWIEALINAGFKKYQILVWKKNKSSFDLSMGGYYKQNNELIIYAHKGFKKLNHHRNPLSRSVLVFDTNNQNRFHSCEKNLSLLYFLIKQSSEEGDVILDPFAGSGNHLIAAKRLNRVPIGFEISEQYYDIILKRLSFEEKQKELKFL